MRRCLVSPFPLHGERQALHASAFPPWSLLAGWLRPLPREGVWLEAVLGEPSLCTGRGMALPAASGLPPGIGRGGLA